MLPYDVWRDAYGDRGTYPPVPADQHWQHRIYVAGKPANHITHPISRPPLDARGAGCSKAPMPADAPDDLPF
jgi:hypothetical protein